ncbi:MAG: helix-turn-helix transcriptional regulator [Abditibacteriota bacterium]|nr:helix-turn-helix transcriptional regulator [Abditibacteriota bacterium]
MIYGKKEIVPEIAIRSVHTAFIKTYNRFVFPGETHPMWELGCVLSGECIFTTGSGVYRASKGDLQLHSPHLLHGLNAEQGSVTIMTVSFEGDGLTKHLRGGRYTAGDKERRLLELLEKEVLKCSRTPLDLTLLKSLLESLLLIMMQKESSVAEPKPLSAEAQTFSELVHYMEQNICKGIATEELEAVSHRCATAIRNIFHKYAGMSPTEYFCALRLAYAKTLLEQGLNVTETAYEMSFSDPGYFSAFFKRREGISPSEYKKRLR